MNKIKQQNKKINEKIEYNAQDLCVICLHTHSPMGPT